MTTNNNDYRPLWVDYKATDHGRQPRRVISAKRIGRPMRNQPVKGAVRLSANTEPRFKHLKHGGALAAAVLGGILYTTQSTGTVDTRVKQEPLLMAAMPTPTFFFNDSDNALGDKQPLLTSDKNVLAKARPNEPGSFVDELLKAGYKAQAFDEQAAFVDEPNMFEPVAIEEKPKLASTTTISPLVNHPSIAAIRKKEEFPEGATTDTVTVAAGDTLSGLLNDRGVNIDQMPQLLTDELVKEHLSNLRIGQSFQVVRLANGDFHSLTARVGNDRSITIRKSSNDFAIASIDLPVEKERVVTAGTIEHSLFAAAAEADLKQSTIMEMSDIFQWELDFARDIRKGDQFSLVYDRLYREGKYIGDGDILAAEFIRGGKTYQAVRYTDPDGNTGYYSPDGRSKKRTFLRHPVDVVRITSRFDPKRLHPVLHQIRAHRGVDYGSPTGTPIRATSDGIVKFAGTKNAYGKTVILAHGSDIRTLYAHMSRISKNARNGKRVKQGDVIGYVGATGRVTGAHLHYEFQKNGKHVDPLKVKLPEAKALDKSLHAELRQVADELMAQMRSIEPAAQVATAAQIEQ